MRHDENWELLLAEYIDGTLSPADLRQVEAHLTACPICREGLAAARSGQATLASALPVGAIPETGDFLEAVERRADRAALSTGSPEGQAPSWSQRLLARLGGPEQAAPAFWFLLCLPVLALAQAPGRLLIGPAVIALCIGLAIEYASTSEAVYHD